MKTNPTTNATPPPWIAHPEDGSIRTPDGIFIACVYDNPDDGLSPIGEEQSDFNRELIASAPDMAAEIERLKAEKGELVAALRRLKRIAVWDDDFTEGERVEFDQAYTQAEAAIAKSEGGV